MQDEDKTKEQLITELKALHQRVAESEKDKGEQKLAAQEAVEYQYYLQTILQTTPDGFWVVDAEGRITEANEAYCRMSGYSLAELLSLRISDIDAIEESAETEAHIRRVIEKGSETFETCHRRKDGSLFDVEVSATYLETGGGRFVCFCRDITERKQAEEALLESENKFKSFAEAAITGINIIQDGVFKYVNPKFAQMFGYTVEECLNGMPFKNLVYAEDLATVEKQVGRRMFGKAESTNYTFRGLKKDGQIFPVEIYGSAIVYQGKPAATGTILDITERNKVQEQIEIIARFPDENPNPILRISSDGKLLYANRSSSAFMESFGWQLGETLPGDWRQHALQTLNSGCSKEMELTCEGVVYSLMLVPVSDFEYLNIYGLDITARKRAEETQRESQRLTKMRLDLIEYAAAHTLDELLTKTLDEVGAFLDSPIGFCHFVEGDQKTLLLQQWSTRTLKEFCRAEGKGMHYSIDQAGVWVDCVYERKPVIHNDYRSLEHKKGMPKGHAEVVRELVVPVMREGKVVAILGVGNKPADYTEKDVETAAYLADVTWEIVEHKLAQEELNKYRDHLEDLVKERTAELAMANEQLTCEVEERRRAEKALKEASEKLKFFAYSVAHDLKSPAIGVYGLTKRLSKHAKAVLDEKGRTYCDQILKVSEHIATLVDKINIYIATKEDAPLIETINIAEILRMLRDEFSAQLSLRRIDLLEPESEVKIEVDRLSMLRIFRNLIDNALKYGGENLTRISIGYEDSENLHIISVSDNGKGLRGADSKKIFGLFQRNATSIGVEGAGMGLAIVKEIAEKYGGRVWVEPGSKEGITFYVSISKTLKS